MGSESPSPPGQPPAEMPVRETPPVLPTGPPPVIPPRLPGHILGGRLHPLTLVFAAWGAVRNLLLPLILVLFFGRKQAMDNFAVVATIFVFMPLAIGFVRYFTFTYRIEQGELITRQGLIRRTQRVIPLSRVQDIRVEQSPMHRIFGVAELYVETAGGEGAEAALSVLARSEADRLRQTMYAATQASRQVRTGVVSESVQLPEREIVRQLKWRDLVLAGLTSNQTASALVIVFVVWGLLDDVIPREAYERFIVRSTGWLTGWFEHAGGAAWAGIALAGLGLLFAGVVVSVIGSIVMFHGFTLSQSGGDLHRTYGLLTRRSSTLARRRIQVLKIEETLLRRLLRLATVRADTAASKATTEQGAGGKDVLLPVIPREDLPALLPVFFPHFPLGEMVWSKVSRRAIRRGMFKGSVMCVLLAASLWAIQRHLWALWPLALLPFIYWINVLNFRYYGYWLACGYFSTRRGWMRRNTHVVPIPNVQAVVIRQTPFDRRHGVATLLVDTAGQAYTGGAPKLENVPWEEALALARSMARKAAATRYRV